MDDEGGKYEQKMTLYKLIVAVVLLVGKSTPASIKYDPTQDYSVNRLGDHHDCRQYMNDDQQIYTCRICGATQSSFNRVCEQQNKHVVAVYGQNTQPFCTSGPIPGCPRPAQPATGKISVKTDRRVYRWRDNAPVYSPQKLTCQAGYHVRGLSVVWCNHTTAKGSTTAAAWNGSLGLCELELITKLTPKIYTTAAINSLKVNITALDESREPYSKIGIITSCVVIACLMVGFIIYWIRTKKNRRQNDHIELASNESTSIADVKTAGQTECTPLIVDIPNDTDGGENNTPAGNDGIDITSDDGIDITINGGVDIRSNDGIDITSNDCVDITSNDRVDITSNDRVDITNNDAIDIASNDRVDITNNDRVDITNNDRVDITNNDRVDITNNDRVDITNNDRVDITNNDRVDITNNDRVDITNNDRGNITSNDRVDITSNDRVDITNNDAIDIASNDSVDITNNDRVDITNNDRVDITNNDRVDITNNDRVDITNNDRVDITNNDRVDITNNDRGNITSNDRVDITNNDRVDIASNDRVDIASNDRVDITSNDRVNINESNNRNRTATVRPIERGMTEQMRQEENERWHDATVDMSLTENAFGTRLG